MKLLTPGPVDIPDEVREAMATPSLLHYGPDWMKLYHETQSMLKTVFGTQNDLYIMAGPGTMALEAIVGSALEPGETVLIPDNGFFAERLGNVAQGLGLKVLSVKVPWGQPVLPDEVAAALDAHPEVKAMLVVHHETSTTVLNPLEAIARVGREHGVLVIVDAVSSLGGVPLPVDAWGIDGCVTVANKALETPPALALLSLSPRLQEAIERRQAPRGWYLDLKTWRWYAENWGTWHPTPVTMPTSNVYALHHSLELLMAEGLETRYAAYRRAAQAVRQGLIALGFPPFVEEAWASPLTTAFRMREGVEADELQAYLRRQGIVISGGLADLHGVILRVGHIGLARQRDYITAFLLGVEAFLREKGIAVPEGSSLVGLA